jgi:hypothetical protein
VRTSNLSATSSSSPQMNADLTGGRQSMFE